MVTNGLEIADAFFIVVIAYLEKRLLRQTANYEDQSHLCWLKRGLKRSESTHWM